MRRIFALIFSIALLMVSGFAFAAPVPGGLPDYFGKNWTNSPIIRKFVDPLSAIPVANPDTITYPGTDYYEINLVEYSQKMHTDLLPTKLRGYVQVNNGTDVNGFNTLTPAPVHYLGPLISAQRDRPVRIKFTNMLPTGPGGDLFIPVDTSVMGAGFGDLGVSGGNYKQNRATLHMHGGHTPWISDGTPHQWITPAGETTAYPKGVSVRDVPDMPASAPGSQTFFYTNQQSARLMFYHDHALGITRLNVYAGEVAGYIISDKAEQNLINAGIIPAEQMPLIIQDKSFVPDPTTLAATDPTWDSAKWGGLGSLWFPHVYMPNQNPNSLTGVNPFGRWDYGPWFWPPVTTAAGLVHPPTTDPVTGSAIPGTPNVSIVPEAFLDTMLVNGTAYPYLEVQRKAYRFRVLNGSNDRFLNLQIHYADPLAPTEVKMVPAVAGTWPVGWPTPDSRIGGWPDPTLVGPPMIQIGTESGFLPSPVVLPNIPIGYDKDPRSITVGNTKESNLFLGPAERGDIIVDFSQVPTGSTLILYNDSPAPVPAGDQRVDYYTGNPDLTAIGGAPSTLAGFGPNTRTVMQFRVMGTIPPAAPFNLSALQTALPPAFTASQGGIIVPQKAHGAATDTYARIQDTALTYTPLGSATPVTVQMQPKAIHELFELNYGRMNSILGVEKPLANFLTQTTIPLAFIDPPTEILQDGVSQLWKVTHNGVDTHAIHFHLMDVQLINRVDWAGVIKPPNANEVGWKETVKMHPLEDVIVALRPTTPKVPFAVPDSVRYLDPTQAPLSSMGFTQLNPTTGNPAVVNNISTNYGWEYVWHCHLLGHEEMDMMRPMVFQPGLASAYIIQEAPTGVVAAAANSQAIISFTPPAANSFSAGITPATSYIVTAKPGGNTATGSASPITVTGLANGTAYSFTVAAVNTAGTGLSSLQSNSVIPSGPSPSYTISVSSGPSGTAFPSGNLILTTGSSQTIAITPAIGYHVANVLVDGVSVGAPASYTFSNITVNHSLVASFAINTYTLTASAGAGGTITPLGATTVNNGSNQAFSITPSAGFYIASLIVDGAPAPLTSPYTFTNITANHTISATFANTYVITASAGIGGTITPTGASSVISGASQIYTITPTVGYHIASLTVDGAAATIAPTFTFTNVLASHTISVSFALDTFSITASAGAGGIISPTGVTIVNYGASQTVTITPNLGFHISSLLVDGISQVISPAFQFTNVISNRTIAVSFAADTFAVTVSAVGNGTIAPTGTQMANYGSSLTCTPTPNPGNRLVGVTLDGISMAAPYTITNITTAHAVVATFALNPSKIGVFRNGQWYYDMNGNNNWDSSDKISAFGIAGDIPFAGDWNGSGVSNIGVFRKGIWYLDMNGNGTWDTGIDAIYTNFGIAGDIPIVGDWDGTGKTKIGVFRNATWYFDTNGNGSWDPGIDTIRSFGISGDIPITGDWNGDGKTKIGVMRTEANGTMSWYLDMNGNGTWDTGIDAIYSSFGTKGDVPITGDWNGDGKTEIGVLRNGQWYLDMNGNGTWDTGTDAIGSFGIAGDKPISGKW